MRILSIETSCDDTSIALVTANLSTSQVDRLMPKFEVLANIVSSQTAIHRHWGGVVPNLAKREHLKNLPKIYKTLTAKRSPLSPDLIAVTVGPGLEPSLWTGIEFAKKLSAELKVPLVGANHLQGHLYSFLLPQNVRGQKTEVRDITNSGQTKRSDIRHPSSVIRYPTIALLVSGGHTMLLLMKDLLHWKLLGETRDDAVGEAFDKVARMLKLPYPGGPEIEKLALRQAQGKLQNPKGTIKFPRPMLHEKNYDFSFSGLKTAVLYYLREHGWSSLRGGTTKQSHNNIERLPCFARNDKTNIAASFQSAAIDVLVTKTIRAVREFDAQTVILCGGVAANTALREALQKSAATAGATFIAPEVEYNTDNAAMIAATAYMGILRQKSKKARKRGDLPMEANGNLGL